MSGHSENTKRVAKNTLLLYGRMLFNLLVSLYSSRLILDALGVSDYGVYNVVGGFVSMFSVVTSALSGASSRFLCFELGKGDRERLKMTFSTSLAIQMILAAVVVLLVETLGVWYLETHMTIPDGRMTAAHWVLQCSLATFVTGLFIVPYDASIIAHEKMDFFALVGILDVLLKLAVALLLAFGISTSDKLIVYAVLLMLCKFVLQAIYFAYCGRKFEECSFRPRIHGQVFRGLFGFASWNFFGSGVSILNNYGVNLVLNMIYGTVVNAARGLSVTVATIISNFVNNFMMALNPQITKSYASGDMDYMRSLVKRGGKFTFFIYMFLALPVWLEADFLINLWLVEVPEHTVNFVRLVLILSLCDVLSNILGMAQNATGNIKYYQIVTAPIQLLNLVLSYLLLRKGSISPEYTYIIAIAVSCCLLVARAFFVRRSIGLSIKDYIRTVWLRLLLVLVISASVPLAVAVLLPDGWLRLLAVCTVSVICSGLSIYFVGCDRGEKEFALDMVRKFLNKFKSK